MAYSGPTGEREQGSIICCIAPDCIICCIAHGLCIALDCIICCIAHGLLLPPMCISE